MQGSKVIFGSFIRGLTRVEELTLWYGHVGASYSGQDPPVRMHRKLECVGGGSRPLEELETLPMRGKALSLFDPEN